MKQTLVRFPNGLRVVLSSRQSNVVTISFSLCFGAEQETKDTKGATHFIERIMRAGLQKEISNLGGVVDSKTDYEHFELTVSTVRENLESAFNALIQTVFDFHPTFQTFESERAAIIREIENRKSNPLMLLRELTQKNRYKTTSLATEVYGTNKTISEMTLERLRDYYNSILSPSSIILSVVGNISDEEEGKEELEEDEQDTTSTDVIIEKSSAKLSMWNAVKDTVKPSKIPQKKYIIDSLDYIKELVTKQFYSKTLLLDKKTKRRCTAYFPLKNKAVIQKPKKLNQTRFQLSFPSAPYSSNGYKYSKLFELYLRSYLRQSLAGTAGLYGVDLETSQFKNNAHLSITFAVDKDRAVEVYNKVLSLLKIAKDQQVSVAQLNSTKIAYQTLLSLGHEKMSELATRYNKWIFLKDELFNLTNEIKLTRKMSHKNFSYICNAILNFDEMLTVIVGEKVDETKLLTL